MNLNEELERIKEIMNKNNKNIIDEQWWKFWKKNKKNNQQIVVTTTTTIKVDVKDETPEQEPKQGMDIHSLGVEYYTDLILAQNDSERLKKPILCFIFQSADLPIKEQIMYEFFRFENYDEHHKILICDLNLNDEKQKNELDKIMGPEYRVPSIVFVENNQFWSCKIKTDIIKKTPLDVKKIVGCMIECINTKKIVVPLN